MIKNKKQKGWAVIYKGVTLPTATKYGDTHTIFMTREMARHYVRSYLKKNRKLEAVEIIPVQLSIKSFR